MNYDTFNTICRHAAGGGDQMLALRSRSHLLRETPQAVGPCWEGNKVMFGYEKFQTLEEFFKKKVKSYQGNDEAVGFAEALLRFGAPLGTRQLCLTLYAGTYRVGWEGIGSECATGHSAQGGSLSVMEVFARDLMFYAPDLRVLTPQHLPQFSLSHQEELRRIARHTGRHLDPLLHTLHAPREPKDTTFLRRDAWIEFERQDLMAHTVRGSISRPRKM